MDDFQRINFSPQNPVVIHNTSPIWLLMAISIGALLPVCACSMLIVAGMIGFGGWAASVDPAQDLGSGPGIGIVELNGPITPGSGLGAGFDAAAEAVIRDIDWMDDNGDVKAIVLLANSPGGEVNATDIIWERLSRVEKPVVVAINGTCASGCYYIAMAGDPNEIYATPGSLIGSIGVISTFINVEELAAEIGIEAQIITTGPNKDFGSPFRELSEDEIIYWREQINVTFDLFVKRVVDGRPNLDEGDVREIANGRVWAAPNAESLGLIDDLKYPAEAYDRAADLGGLGSSYRIIESPYQPGLLDLFFSSSPGFNLNTEISLPDSQEFLDSLQQSPLQYRYLGPAGNTP